MINCLGEDEDGNMEAPVVAALAGREAADAVLAAASAEYSAGIERKEEKWRRRRGDGSLQGKLVI
jgi:hypothetical protein